MSQFFGQQYLAAQYFRPQYLHGAGTATDARSGYWRLFYYQLQEAELEKEKLKREQAQSQKTAQGTVQSTGKDTASSPAPKPRKLTPAQKSSNTQTPVEGPLFNPKKLFVVPKRQEQLDVAPLLKSISDDLTAWALHSQELSVKFQAVEKKKLEEEAANDEEVITLLLMAA